MQSVVLTRIHAKALWLVVTNARPVENIPIEAIDYALQHCTEYKYARTFWEFVEINHIQIKEEGIVL
jgi:hypothetical protein